MKKKRLVDLPELIPVMPFADEISMAATRLKEKADGEEDPLSYAAFMAGAVLLQKVADGTLGEKDGVQVLKELFSKKTPDPVQEIRQDITIDLCAIFAEAQMDNPNTLTASLEAATAVRLEIQEKLKMGNRLELPPSEVQSNQDGDDDDGEYIPGTEPAEIGELRRSEGSSSR